MDNLDDLYKKYVEKSADTSLVGNTAPLAEIEPENIERCFVDDVTRSITIPESLQIAGVEADNNVKRIFFETDREAQIVDLSQLEVYINYLNANGEADRYHCDDKKIVGDRLQFSWLISDFATKYKGQIRFIVCMENTNGEHWNTTVHELTVLEGLETTETIVEQNPTILEKILTSIENTYNKTDKVPASDVTYNGKSLAQAIEDGDLGGGLEPLIGTTSDYKPSQVIEAIKAGRQVVITSGTGDEVKTFASWVISSNSNVVFGSCSRIVNLDEIMVYCLHGIVTRLGEDDTWTISNHTAHLLPYADTDNNGQIPIYNATNEDWELVPGPLVGSTATVTPEDVKDALLAGRQVILTVNDDYVCNAWSYNAVQGYVCGFIQGFSTGNYTAAFATVLGFVSGNSWSNYNLNLMKNSLDITITASLENDGGEPSVEVVEGGSVGAPTFNLVFKNFGGSSNSTFAVDPLVESTPTVVKGDVTS